MRSPYIIFDRDGTLIEHIHHLVDPDLVKIKSRLIIGLHSLKKQGFSFGIITNQSVINRGFATKEVVDQVNERTLNLLKNEGIEFKFIKYCPHLPDDLCKCRKPANLLGLQAINEASRSFMIGDMESDVIFGHAIGFRSIQLTSDESSQSEPDFVAADMIAAAEWILKVSKGEK
jgi:histidinol-phosphate phosphatase family protein